MIDKLYINNIDVQEQYGFWLNWKEISLPTFKSNYVEIPGMDSALNLSKSDGRVYYDLRTIKLSMTHPEKDYDNDLDSLSSFHGEEVTISFASDLSRYFVGTLNVVGYNTKERKLEMSGLVYPFRFEKQETIYTISSSRTVNLVNDSMFVTPKVQIVGGNATLAWKTYTKTISEGTYYIDELVLGKKEVLPITITLGTATKVVISYRKGRL